MNADLAQKLSHYFYDVFVVHFDAWVVLGFVAQAMFTAIIRQHQALGTPGSAATLTRIRATLRAALNAAIRRGLISENPAAKAELPRARRPRAVVWTPYRVAQWRRSGERPAVAVWTSAGRHVPDRDPRAPAVRRLSPDRAARPAPGRGGRVALA